jgi:hypothetical protein
MKTETLLLLGGAIAVGYLIAKQRAAAAAPVAVTTAAADLTARNASNTADDPEHDVDFVAVPDYWGWGVPSWGSQSWSGFGRGGHGHGGHGGGHGGHGHGGHH